MCASDVNVQAIIWDVDGVLIKSKDALGRYLWHKNIEADLGLSTDQMRRIYSGNWPLVMKGIVDTRQYFKTVFAELDIKLSVDLFIEYWLEHDLNINTEIFPILETIERTKLYIGTNQDSFRTTFIQQQFEPYFNRIFSSCKMGFIKPERGFFEYIESNLNIRSKNIAFIDDSESNINVAEQFGWSRHHYQNIESLKNFILHL